MAAFTPPFNPTAVTRQPELIVTLPDPQRSLGDPLIRPGIARYPGATLVLLRVGSGTPFALTPAVTGAARVVDLATGSLPGIDQLLEVSPLPFGIAPVLRALHPGMPTFYLGAPAITLPDDDERVEHTVPLDSVSDAVVGLMFQDGVTLAPWAWIELLRRAMADTGDTDGAAEWGALANLYAGVRALRVLDSTGRPLADAAFDIRIRRADSTFEGPFTRTTGADGDLEQAVAASPLPRAGGPQASLFGAPPEQTELSWRPTPIPGDTPLPVHALYETGTSAGPSTGSILLPAGTTRAHLQVLDLARWFAPRTPDTSPALGRFREHSRVQPLVDGVDTFELLVHDLLAAAAPGLGAHFAAYALRDFPLDAGRLDHLGQPVDTHLTALTRRIIDGGGDARFLVHKFINLDQDPDTAAKFAAIVALIALSNIVLLLDAIGVMRTDAVGYGVVLGGRVLLNTAIASSFSVTEELEKRFEMSLDTVPLLNAIRNNIALWARHPARLRDNPLAEPLPLNLDTFGNKFGAWHTKIQLVRRAAATASGIEHVAYLGGIDINQNRLDTPGHQIAGPYHDVHARVTGPGAADVFLSWDELYAYHRSEVPDSLEPAFPPPDPAALDEQPARHIVQVGRTYYRAHPDDRPAPLTFAPEGDTSTYDTLLRAIREAREYIYIEDQYFTPNDSEPPGSADTYFDALLEAAGTCKRLVILVPAETDQPFGDLRRRYLFSRLRDPSVWGDRVLIGAPLRRHVLNDPGRITSEGRCYLMEPIGMPGLSGLDTLILGPAARVPDTFPYWLWIDGELMLTAGLPFPMTTAGVLPTRGVDVLRGPIGTDPRWGATPRPHQRFAPVTMAQLKAIYQHAKIMIVDDVFVSIGTSNLNRRGFFYDGEINVFAVPEQLKAAADNPARALRTALWAEHLGIAPTMGPALLGDPIAAFELFRRSRLEGNRFTPFEAMDLKPYLGVPVGDGMVVNILAATAIGWVESQIPLIWNDASDPTSFSELSPVPGPVPS